MKKTLLSLLAFSALMAQGDNIHHISNSEESSVTAQPAVVSTAPMPAHEATCNCDMHKEKEIHGSPVLEGNSEIRISVIGEGVAPMNTASPAQAYALAKRAAIADGYRQIAEKVKGVRVEGQDLIKNMMVKRSTIRTSVNAMVRDANIVETTFKEGLCEVEMEIVLSGSQFVR